VIITSDPAPTVLGISYANHPVAGGASHSKLIITPTDQEKYATNPLFNNFDANGNRYATIGSGPDSKRGNGLWADTNRDRDVRQPNNNQQRLAIPTRYQDENAAIAALIGYVIEYNKHPVQRYAAIPTGSTNARNSNSFISGILIVAGFQLPTRPGGNVPGFNLPVPARFFLTPRPRPRRSRFRQGNGRKLKADELTARRIN
jgi:hypothetical protein